MSKKVFGRGVRCGEALFLAAAVVMLLGALWLEREQTALSDSVLRLHVLANSDEQADQELKLKVRDRVLEEADAILADGLTLEETKKQLAENLARLAEAGAEAVAEEGYDYSVSASIEQTWFPTKEYQDFSLPAGEYQALRIVIGEGLGRNWWCVVYPPLCMGAVSESAADVAANAGMADKQVGLLVGETDGYVIKFKALELWDRIKLAFS